MFTDVCNLVNELIELFYLKFDKLGVSAYSNFFRKRSGKFGYSTVIKCPRSSRLELKNTPIASRQRD